MTPNEANWEQAATYLRDARRVVAFTGAGISAESGIETFRDQGGFWTEFAPETFATFGGLTRTAILHPRRLARFLHSMLKPVAEAKPNAAHQAIAELEKHVDVTVVTQNVDGLHQEAGSTTVHEIHGSLFQIETLRRRFVRRISRADLARMLQGLENATVSWTAAPRLILAIRSMVGLSRHGVVRPGVVLFEEELREPDWTNALEDSRRCDAMLVVGTSGVVAPAATLPYEAMAECGRVIAIDPYEPKNTDVWLQGTACQIVPELLTRAFGTE